MVKYALKIFGKNLQLMLDISNNLVTIKYACIITSIVINYASIVIEYMGRFPSGQRGQTVNLLQLASMVRIHLCPLKNLKSYDLRFLCYSEIII